MDVWRAIRAGLELTGQAPDQAAAGRIPAAALLAAAVLGAAALVAARRHEAVLVVAVLVAAARVVSLPAVAALLVVAVLVVATLVVAVLVARVPAAAALLEAVLPEAVLPGTLPAEMVRRAATGHAHRRAALADQAVADQARPEHAPADHRALADQARPEHALADHRALADRERLERALLGQEVPRGVRAGRVPSGGARQTAVAPAEVGAREPAARAGTHGLAGPAMAAAVLGPLPNPRPGAGETATQALIAASTVRAGANQPGELRRLPEIADLVAGGRAVMAGIATIRSPAASRGRASSRVQVALGGVPHADGLRRALANGSAATGLLAVANGSAGTGRLAVANGPAGAGRRVTGPARANRGPPAAVLTAVGALTTRAVGATGGVQTIAADRPSEGGQARPASATGLGRAAGIGSGTGLGRAAGIGSAVLLATAGRGGASQLTNCAWLSRRASPLISWIRKPWQSCARCRGTLPALLPGCLWRPAPATIRSRHISSPRRRGASRPELASYGRLARSRRIRPETGIRP